MNPLKYVRNGLIGLSMLASAALGFDPSLRQTEVVGGYTQDSTKSGFAQVHQQFENSDGFLRYDKGEGNYGIDGYLNPNFKHLLGEGSIFGEVRKSSDGNKEDKSYLGILEHSVINYKKFKSKVGYDLMSSEFKNGNKTISDSTYEIIGEDEFGPYHYIASQNDTSNSTIQGNQKNVTSHLKLEYGELIKTDFFTGLLENNQEQNTHSILRHSTYYPDYDYSYVTFTDIMDRLEDNNKIDTRGIIASSKIWKNEIGVILKDFKVNSSLEEIATVTDSTASIPVRDIKYTVNSTEEYNQFGISNSLRNLFFIKDLSLFYLRMSGNGTSEYFNSDWLPNDAGAENKSESEIKTANVLIGNRFMHNLKFRMEDYTYSDAGDTGVFGFNPDIAREKGNKMSLSYDFIVPFSSWGVDNLIKYLTFRFLESNLEGQEDRVLRFGQVRRTNWIYSPITKTNLHFAYKTENNELFDDKKGLEIYEFGAKHCVLNLRNVVLSPFYNLSINNENKSVKIDSATFDNSSSKYKSHEFGLEGIITGDLLFKVSAEKESDWKFRIYIQKIFSPIKREWFD